MTEQSPDPDLKENNYRKWIEDQSTEALEKELRTLELRRTALQIRDRGMEAHIKLPEQEDEEEEWGDEWDQIEARMSPKEFDEYVASMDAEFRAQDEAIAWSEKVEAMEPEKRAQVLAKRDAWLAAQEAAERAQRLARIDQEVLGSPWLAEQMEVVHHLEAIKRELAARRTQELSKGEAASALAGAPKLPKSPAGRRCPIYPAKMKIKQAILAALRKDLGASDLEVCRKIDKKNESMNDKGRVKLKASWSKGGKYGLFADACGDPDLKQRVHSEITRVRTDLRDHGWPVPYRRGPRTPLTSLLTR
jgi:hypothetical protein